MGERSVGRWGCTVFRIAAAEGSEKTLACTVFSFVPAKAVHYPARRRLCMVAAHHCRMSLRKGVYSPALVSSIVIVQKTMATVFPCFLVITRIQNCIVTSTM